MLRPKLLHIALAAGLLLSACASTPKIYVDQDPAQDFSSYQTFSWAKTPPISVAGDYEISPLHQKRITDAIETDLKAKGYRYTPALSAADFAVAATIGARDEVHMDAYPSTFYGAYDSWGWGMPYYPGPAYMDPYYDYPMEYSSHTTHEGTLSIDVYDVRKRQPVWHGQSSKNVNPNNMGSVKEDVSEGIDAVLEKFPVRAATP